jgi:NAD(P)-dependent dehydrogenase (short-subunit alcohol dehydrogenase family)
MKYTIVTGAASDIGKAICKKLVHNGHNILMMDIDKKSMEEYRDTLPNPENHFCLVVDFSDIIESEKKIKSFILNNHLEVKSAVFAAGIFSIKPLRMLTYNYFQKSFDIAAYSIIQIMQIVTSKKVNSDNFESAVIVSSISAKIGTKGYVLYSAVKSSLLGLMHSMAVEFAPKVRLNSILPGSIRTKATAFILDSLENTNPRSLLGNGTPSDIANLINFLLSDESIWITGQEFIIDGGSSIN